MAILVTDTGFQLLTSPVEFTEFAQLETMTPGERIEISSLSLSPDTEITAISDLLATVRLIEVRIDTFADGRGFSLARRLRLRGYKGTLRASGHVLADQYRLARQVGFDEVAISDDMARRQPEEQWKQNDPVPGQTYQTRLMKPKAA